MEDEKIININPDHIESVEFRKWAAVKGMPAQFSRVVHVVSGRRFITEYETEAEYEVQLDYFSKKWGKKFNFFVVEK